MLGGQAESVKLLLTNTSGIQFNGPLTIDIYASTSSALPSDSSPIGSVSIPTLTLGDSASNASKDEKVRFTMPQSMANGSYYLVATVDATATGTAPSDPVTPATFDYSQPAVSLTTAFASALPISVVPGKGVTCCSTSRTLATLLQTERLR